MERSSTAIASLNWCRWSITRPSKGKWQKHWSAGESSRHIESGIKLNHQENSHRISCPNDTFFTNESEYARRQAGSISARVHENFQKRRSDAEETSRVGAEMADKHGHEAAQSKKGQQRRGEEGWFLTWNPESLINGKREDGSEAHSQKKFASPFYVGKLQEVQRKWKEFSVRVFTAARWGYTGPITSHVADDEFA